MKWCSPVHILSLITLFSFSVSTAHAQLSITNAVEKGVPERLAQHRSKVLSSVQYNMLLSIPVSKAEKIKGEITIAFDLKKDGVPLQLDFKESPEHIKAVKVNGKEVKTVHKNEHLVIDPAQLANGPNKIHIVFTAGELSLNRNNDFLYTLLVPDRARTVFPCFDQPSIKARYQLSLTVPKDWLALANARLKDSVVSGVAKTYHYAPSDLFSTYLFSFVAGRFTVASKQVEGKPMHLYYRETDSTKIRLSRDTIFGLHGLSLRYLEEYTGIPYPFQKLDFAAIPDFQYGGMEHVGAIDYKASTLFLDSGATRDQENARSSLIAHETAHMWFGDLVTMQWFNDVWMKEVFANFMADKITQSQQDKGNYELKFLLTHFPRAYSIDRTAGANPIRQALPNLQEAGSLYGPIIYNKAPVMMRQLERVMGAEAFRDGLRAYLKTYAFGNATWPDLIRILDERTPIDLQAWNKVWVNTPGRPVITYSLQQKENKITRLTLTQKGERTKDYLLPQFFELALVYPDRVEEVTVHIQGTQAEVAEVKGKPAPLYILFNTSGQGYGLFPMDPKATAVHQLQSPVMRASAYINAYENMLSGNAATPAQLLTTLLNTVQEGREPDELILNMIASHLSDVYWRLLPASKRTAMAPAVEQALWKAMLQDSVANRKKVLFRTYQSVALSKSALDTLHLIWAKQQPPTGVRLSEDEYISLALNLTVKGYGGDTLLRAQEARITNPDRKQRLLFLMPAVSGNQQVRDSFYASLKDPVIRKKESWVADALGYLHHPLRTATSVKYLPQALNMLQEVQQTGDIFFPAAWLNASLGNHQSKEAAAIVRNFLHQHPGYNAQLRMKILQAADPLFRAERLAK
ncbi:MAG TPA: M1 family aminopeptidase [Chitinophagaceae bacterium]